MDIVLIFAFVENRISTTMNLTLILVVKNCEGCIYKNVTVLWLVRKGWVITFRKYPRPIRDASRAVDQWNWSCQQRLSKLKLARQNLAQLTERPGLALLCTGTVKIHTVVKLTIFCKKKPSRNLKLSLIYLKNSFIILVFNLFLALRLDQDCPIQRFNFMKPKEQKYFVTKLEFFCTINSIFDWYS